MIDVNLINGIALAFEGDAVYSMYIRRHLILKGMTKPNKLHQEATKYVSAKAQARLISLMLEEEVLTEKEEEIIKYIIADMHRGVTTLPARGEFTDQDKRMLYCLVTSRQMITLKNRILSCDPKAFISILDVSEVKGRGFQNL